MDLKRACGNGFLALAMLICTGALPAYANSVNLLTNGSFETPTVAGTDVCGPYSNCLGFHNGVNTNIGGWEMFGLDGLGADLKPNTNFATLMVLNSNYTEPTNNSQTLAFHPQDGSQSLDLTGEGNQGLDQGVKQTVGTNAGSTYLLTFWFGHQYSQADGYLGTSALFLYINGNPIGSYGNSLDTVNDITWTQFSYQFTATDQTTVQFRNNAYWGDLETHTPGNNFAGLDNVSLVAVPEAASLTLLGIGTTALILLRRRASQARD